MPRKPRRRRRRKRRSYSMTRLSGPGLSSTSPLPKVFKWKTKYVETIVGLNPGAAGIMANYLFSCNGLYDPDITGAGHQPIGFDQLMPLYDHYRVIGSRIRATFANTDSTFSQMVGIKIQDNTTVSETDMGILIENGPMRWTTVAALNGGDSVKTLTMNFSAKNYFGKSALSDNDYRGDVSNNPDEQAYFRLVAQPTSANDSGDVRVTVEIEYIAILSEAKNLAQS